MNEINEIKEFLQRAITALEKEVVAYRGFLSLLEEAPGEISPETAKMLFDLARKDNRYMGRTQNT